jgi:hypothetical protein
MRTYLILVAALFLGPKYTAYAQTSSTVEPSNDTGSAAPHAAAVQGGWWNIEAEYRAPFRLFVDLGIPWVVFTLHATGDMWKVPFETKVGYQYDLSEQWKLRGGVRGAISIERAKPCMDSCASTEEKSFLFLEFGARYEHPSGLVVGVELPLFVLEDFIDIFSGKTSSMEILLPVAFAQVYIGYQWRFQ